MANGPWQQRCMLCVVALLFFVCSMCVSGQLQRSDVCVHVCVQVTRQLGPQAQQPTQVPAAAPTPAPQPQTCPSKDMAVNTDMDMGSLEELVMNPDVMIPNPADPFSMQHSYPQPHMSDASTSSRSHQYDAQQHAVYPQPQMADASSSSSQYGAQQQPRNPIVGNAGVNGVGGGDGGQPARQPSQPIFFQGQWFTPAPPGFTPPPPPPQQHQYGVTHQQQQGQGQQQQHLHAGYQHQQHPGYQSYQQPPQHQQQQAFAQLPQSLAMPSGQSGTAPAVYSAPTGQVRPSPGPTAGNAGSQEQAWSPTSAYQFESPTFRNGAAHQLSPGPSGRTWSPAASDVTRLTVPQAEPATSQQKVRLWS